MTQTTRNSAAELSASLHDLVGEGGNILSSDDDVARVRTMLPAPTAPTAPHYGGASYDRLVRAICLEREQGLQQATEAPALPGTRNQRPTDILGIAFGSGRYGFAGFHCDRLTHAATSVPPTAASREPGGVLVAHRS